MVWPWQQTFVDVGADDWPVQRRQHHPAFQRQWLIQEDIVVCCHAYHAKKQLFVASAQTVDNYLPLQQILLAGSTVATLMLLPGHGKGRSIDLAIHAALNDLQPGGWSLPAVYAARNAALAQQPWPQPALQELATVLQPRR